MAEQGDPCPPKANGTHAATTPQVSPRALIVARLADLIRRIATGELKSADIADALRKEAAELEPSSRARAQDPSAAAEIAAAVTRIYQHWLTATERKASEWKLTPERRTKVAARLRDGYTEARICAAVDGVALDPFLRGENDRNTRHDDLTFVCRNGSQVEKYSARANERRAASEIGERHPDRTLADMQRAALKRGDDDGYRKLQRS